MSTTHIIMHAKDRLTLREAHLVLTALRDSPNAIALRGAIEKLERCIHAASKSSKEYAYLTGNTKQRLPRRHELRLTTEGHD